MYIYIYILLRLPLLPQKLQNKTIAWLDIHRFRPQS